MIDRVAAIANGPAEGTIAVMTVPALG
jgi:hypothetical protein